MPDREAPGTSSEAVKMNWFIHLWDNFIFQLNNPAISNVTCNGECGLLHPLGIVIPLVAGVMLLLLFVKVDSFE